MSVLTPEPAEGSVMVPEQVLVDLAQVLAHRLRGLVASIEGFTDLLTDTLFSRDQRELALRILEGAARIERVLADLQRYGDPVEPVQLPLLVGDVTADLLAPLPEPERARVTLRHDHQPATAELPLLADPFLLRQALLVLVQNALDATRHGGDVHLVVRTDDAGWVCFDVWNTGFIDLPSPETQVFLPFFTTKAQNLGVGLPMAARIAVAHGGAVSLTLNDPAAGTCFTLALPVAPEEAGLDLL